MNFSARLGSVIFVSLLGFGTGLGGCKKAETPALAKTQPTTTAAGTTAAAADARKAAAVPDGVQKLLGRWVRPDGGYILELKNPDLSGKIEATYHNPSQNRTVNVSRAIWMQGGQGLQVAVELNDANAGYSGATYLLGHDEKSDRLTGQYAQPQMQQTYEIEFIRQNAVPMR